MRRSALASAALDGVNAGSLLIAASTLLKQAHLPFAINAQTPTNTDEIWNQPAYRYHVYDYRTLTTAQAADHEATVAGHAVTADAAGAIDGGDGRLFS